MCVPGHPARIARVRTQSRSPPSVTTARAAPAGSTPSASSRATPPSRSTASNHDVSSVRSALLAIGTARCCAAASRGWSKRASAACCLALPPIDRGVRARVPLKIAPLARARPRSSCGARTIPDYASLSKNTRPRPLLFPILALGVWEHTPHLEIVKWLATLYFGLSSAWPGRGESPRSGPRSPPSRRPLAPPHPR